MKTNTVSGKGTIPYNRTEQVREELKEQETIQQREQKEKKQAKKMSEVENKNAHMYHLDAVKKLIGENIQWREMRFYQHEADGKRYVDIIDKKTGEVIRTVPEPEFVKIATEFKHLAGMNLNING
ncbi:MAG: flagellar protein FlaG [bacterium]